MKTSIITVAVVAMLVLAFAPFCLAEEAENEFEKGEHTLMLSGGGISSEDFSGNKTALEVELGYFWTDTFATAVRQELSHENFGRRGLFSASTAIAADRFWALPQVSPFVGANVGVVYGNHRGTEIMLGPEAGVRKRIGEVVFVNLMAQYEMVRDPKAQTPDERWGGRFAYTLGLGMRY